MTTTMLGRRIVSVTDTLRKKWILIAFVIALAVFIYANSRLVYLAFEFQPECIEHQKQGTSGVTAAKSSC